MPPWRQGRALDLRGQRKLRASRAREEKTIQLGLCFEKYPSTSPSLHLAQPKVRLGGGGLFRSYILSPGFGCASPHPDVVFKERLCFRQAPKSELGSLDSRPAPFAYL